MAAHLGLERAKATTSTLQAIGLPAAVLRANGRVMSTNALFDGLTSLFMPVAFGRLMRMAKQTADFIVSFRPPRPQCPMNRSFMRRTCRR